ncbi:hypothetical protein LVJ94_23955 [Pendulispora rubella]|uniref:Uncharacterized protein n=1 Tax=Pendulispora rubella TaxID=2741070 RepID=A0ABZ2LIR7_9BACT
MAWVKFIGCIAFLFGLAWSSRAGAVNVADKDFGFDLAPDDATVCVSFPKEQQDPKACAGVDVESVNARVSTLEGGSGEMRPITAMVVRSGKSFYVVLVMHNGKTHEEFSKEAARALARSGRDARRITYGEKAFPPEDDVDPTEMRINGVQVIRYELTPRLAADDPRRIMSYQLQYFAATGRGNYSIGFFASPEDVNTVNVLAQRAMATLRAPPGAAPSHVPESDAALYAAEAFGAVVAFSVGLFLVVRSRNRRLKPAPPVA